MLYLLSTALINILIKTLIILVYLYFLFYLKNGEMEEQRER